MSTTLQAFRSFRDANTWLSAIESPLPSEPARAIVELLTSADPSPHAYALLDVTPPRPGLVQRLLGREPRGLVTSAVICSGRGSYKTSIAVIAAIDRLLRYDHGGVVAEGSEVVAVVISPTKAQASGALRNARPIAEKLAAFLGGRLRERSAADSAEFIFEGLGLPYVPILRVGVADEAAVRGSATCAVVFDEASWFPTGDEYSNTDEAIEVAATPRLLQFGARGLFLRVSTPGLIGGRFHRDVTEPKPGTLVIGPLPTWRINPLISEQAARAQYDESTFRQELECSTWGARESQFIDAAHALSCIDRDGEFHRGPRELGSAIVAVDVANVSDNIAFAVGYYAQRKVSEQTAPVTVLVIDHCEFWTPTATHPIGIERISAHASALSAAYGGATVIADQRSFVDLGEELAKRGFKVCNDADEDVRARWIRRGGRVLVQRGMAAQLQTPRWTLVRDLAHGRRLSLPNDEAGKRAAKELATLRATQLPTTKMLRVNAASGSHDDLADCIALLAEACAWRPRVTNDGLRRVQRNDGAHWDDEGIHIHGEGVFDLVDKAGKVVGRAGPDPASRQYPEHFIRQIATGLIDGDAREFLRLRVGEEDPPAEVIRHLINELVENGEVTRDAGEVVHLFHRDLEPLDAIEERMQFAAARGRTRF